MKYQRKQSTFQVTFSLLLPSWYPMIPIIIIIIIIIINSINYNSKSITRLQSFIGPFLVQLELCYWHRLKDILLSLR